jgi:hypothetical protein
MTSTEQREVDIERLDDSAASRSPILALHDARATGDCLREPGDRDDHVREGSLETLRMLEDSVLNADMHLRF